MDFYLLHPFLFTCGTLPLYPNITKGSDWEPTKYETGLNHSCNFSYRVVIGDIVPDRREEFSVQSIVTHDDFSDKDGSNDIAVVTLKQRFDSATPDKGRYVAFDGIVRPLCLPGKFIVIIVSEL